MTYILSRQCSSNQIAYTIRPGDTLYAIAYRFQVSVSSLLNTNPGVNPYNLRIGDILCIAVCPPNHTIKIIQSGDTLYKIAQAYHISVDSILAANPGVNPYILRIGQRICIPLIDSIKEQIRGMTLEEKIGQMVLVGFDGYEVNDPIREMIRRYHVGGVILYSYNVKSPWQLLALINTLKSVNSMNKIPLFMSVDEEGGRVSRMPPELKKLPASQVIGKLNRTDIAYKIGNVIAKELKAFGFNMDFAPVLDINSNPNNPVIGDRSFGNNPEIVSRLGVQTMKGLQAGGIIPVVKHFPGHGDTSVDSHIGLPSLNHDLNRLEGFELIPFAEAIRNGADAVMVAHILLNKIDPANPASLSKTFINDILRKQMGFNGVVITDDMTMGAILKNYDIGSAAVKSVNAGSDIVLVSRGYDNQVKVLSALKKAVEAGAISRERIDESVYRILKLKNKYKLQDTRINSIDVNPINKEIEAVLQAM